MPPKPRLVPVDSDPGLDDQPAPAGAGGSLITVVGAKGGVGKTTVATNLAAAIVQDIGLSVLLIDLDSRFGDLAVAFDLKPEYSLVDVARIVDHDLTEQGFRRALTPHTSGIEILAAPKHPAEWSEVSPDQLRAILRWGRDLFDYVILDSPGAFTDLVATAIEEADHVLLMSSLERTSLKNTRSTLTLLADEALTLARVDLILNQVHAPLVITAAEAEAVLGRPALIRIDYDEQVVRANAIGVPVVLAYPKARAARQFRQLVGYVVPAHPGTLAEQSRSLWRFPERFAFWRGRSAA